MKRVVPRALGAARTLMDSALSDSVVVLNYHRVNAIPSCASNLTVTAENFREHMRVLRERYEPIRLDSLSDLEQAFRARANGKKRVAVTFDDGYADTFNKALPALDEFQVPATVFVTTGNLDGSREFWWDEVEELVMERIPDDKLDSIFGLVGDGPIEPKVTVPACAKRRSTYYAQLTPLLKYSTEKEIQLIMAKLRKLAGCGALERDTHRSMTVEELKRLAANPLIEIGAHTVNHLCLSTLERHRQHEELRSSKEFLERTLGIKVTSVAYPFGDESAYNRDTLAVDQELDFSLGLTTRPGVVSPRTRKYEVPRMFVKNWTVDEFDRSLKKFFWIG
ncbi:MAG: polysaccharide deacetylase family protein [Deltaproteobacteria bacterium]|nr:polysaccharide deacetylase family protein [Deltaproteobacteria bacterium]